MKGGNLQRRERGEREVEREGEGWEEEEIMDRRGTPGGREGRKRGREGA